MRSPTWPQVATITIMLAAIVLAHMFAKPTVSAITSIVSTLVGAFFIDLGRKPTEVEGGDK